VNESGRKSTLVEKIRLSYPKLVVFRHEDHFTAGVPDISITDAFSRPSYTLWLEVKFYRTMKLRKIQQDVLSRLGGFFVVYDCDSEPLTLIVDAQGRYVNHGRLHAPVLALIRSWVDQEHHAIKHNGKELCPRCHRWAKLNVDHIEPVSLGGAKFDPQNKQLLCEFCHVDKTALDGSTLQIPLTRVRNKLKTNFQTP